LQWHPDRNRGNEVIASKKFQEVGQFPGAGERSLIVNYVLIQVLRTNAFRMQTVALRTTRLEFATLAAEVVKPPRPFRPAPAAGSLWTLLSCSIPCSVGVFLRGAFLSSRSSLANTREYIDAMWAPT
jgi:hypothetical protein